MLLLHQALPLGKALVVWPPTLPHTMFSMPFHFVLLVERVHGSLTRAQLVIFLLRSEGGRAQVEGRAGPPLLDRRRT